MSAGTKACLQVEVKGVVVLSVQECEDERTEAAEAQMQTAVKGCYRA